MEVTVVSGSGLKGDIIGAPDVYVVLKYEGQVHKTSVVSSKDPVWRQAFQIAAKTEPKNGSIVGKGTLEVEVWDKDRLSKDDLLGTGNIDLGTLEWNRKMPKVIDLKKGQVTLEIKATEFGVGKQVEPPAAAPVVKKPEQPLPEQNVPSPSKPTPPDFPVYQGPCYYEGEDPESKYYPRRISTNWDDIESRRMHEVLDTFPSYHGQRQLAPTPSRLFRPSPDFPGGDGPGKRPSTGYGGGHYGGSQAPHRPQTSYGSPPPPPPKQPSGGAPSSGAAAPTAPETKKKHADIGTLHITVMKATGLKAATDCALRLKIEDKKIETTVKKDTLTPQWNESFKFFVRLSPGNQPGIRLGRTATMPLQLTLLDKKSNEELGTAVVPLQDLYEGKGTEIPAAQLKDNTGNTIGEVSLTLKPLAFGLKFYKGRLRCKIEKAVELRSSGTDPDTYVVMRLRDEKQTTQVVRSSTNPEWQEEFVFNPDVFEKRGVVQCPSDLVVELMAKVGGREEKLGAGTVQLDSVLQRMTQKKTIDLIEQGKLYLQIEAENFGLPVVEEPLTKPPPAAYSEAPTYQSSQSPQATQSRAVPTATAATATSAADRPILPGYSLPAAATTPAPPPAPPASRSIPGVPVLDADDAAIAALKQELYELRRQGTALEKDNAERVLPLQVELNVVKAQLDRANVQIDRLQAPEGYIAMDTFGRRGPSPPAGTRSPPRSPPRSPARSPARSPTHGHGDGSLHSPARSPTGQGRGAAQPWVPLVGEVPEFMTIDERNRLKAHNKPYSAFDPSGGKRLSAASGAGRDTLADRTNPSGHGGYGSHATQPGTYTSSASSPTYRFNQHKTPVGQSYFIDPYTGQKVNSLAELSGSLSRSVPQVSQPAVLQSPKAATAGAITTKPGARARHTKTDDLYSRGHYI